MYNDCLLINPKIITRKRHIAKHMAKINFSELKNDDIIKMMRE